MPILKPLIHVVTLGSERPIRRLLAYYLIVVGGFWRRAECVPSTQNLILVKGAASATLDASTILQDGKPTAATTDESMLDAGSLRELAATTSMIMLGTLLLMLPVSWVYMSARSVTGHSQEIVTTLIILHQ